MNIFKDAIAQHAEWKEKLQQHLEGGIKLDAADVANSHLCALGKWIYGEGVAYNQLPSFEALCYYHDRFHRAAAELVSYSNQGETTKMLALLKDDGVFMKSSKNLMWALSECSKELAHGIHIQDHQTAGDIRQILKQKVGNRPHSIDSSASVGEAIHFMSMHHVGYLVVYKEREFIGIFSEQWFVRNFSEKGLVSLTSPIADFINTEILSIDPYATIEQSITLMMTTRKWHLPVMDNNQLLGVISLGDLFKHLVSADRDGRSVDESYPSLFAILQTL